MWRPQWAAIPFVRQPACVPAEFNLLDGLDFTPAFPGGPPRSFFCDLTVEGPAVFKNGPPPIDFAPVMPSAPGPGCCPDLVRALV